MGCVLGALPIGFIVGGYLWVFFPPPDTFGTLPVWAGMMASVTISSLIAIAVIGYVLLWTLSRRNVIEPLKSHGLKVVDADG
jgi:predicted membrane protein